MSQKLKTAIVEDELLTAEFIKQATLSFGHEVLFVTSSAEEAVRLYEFKKPDLIFLDINVAGAKDGIWFANKLRESNSCVEFIYITAYSDTQTLHEAAQTTPVNYLTKPFTAKELEIVLLLAQKKAEVALRQSTSGKCGKSLKIDETYIFDFDKNTLLKNGEAVKLTKKELEAIRFFSHRKNGLVTHEQLSAELWDEKEISESMTRDIVYRIRKKAPGLRVESVSALGYRLTTC